MTTWFRYLRLLSIPLDRLENSLWKYQITIWQARPKLWLWQRFSPQKIKKLKPKELCRMELLMVNLPHALGLWRGLLIRSRQKTPSEPDVARMCWIVVLWLLRLYALFFFNLRLCVCNIELSFLLSLHNVFTLSLMFEYLSFVGFEAFTNLVVLSLAVYIYKCIHE